VFGNDGAAVNRTAGLHNVKEGRREMRLWTWIIGLGWLAGMATAPAAATPDHTPPPAALVHLFDAWRAAVAPPRLDGVADFGPAALAGQATKPGS
jgi:hypothetical protein